ncbi:hypothetical protein M5K25_011876 [Dendrobium thyrsiflorum]|uniref:Terpene synthase metal-binding domain-containing protein n=1 Tax=Dendrobium thyrsiflorum TaxID=117978 RepID=A0ABD0V4A5_DENTH
MEQPLGFAEIIERMKEELFSPSANLFTLLPVSAYDTAWVAMVPDPDDPTSPMFPEYLDWVLRRQNALGFWFDEQQGFNNDHHELIDYKHQCSSDDLLATLACLIALKTWEINGFSHRINKGLRFLRDNMEKELMNMRKRKEGDDEVGHALFRRWFLMVELAKAKGLKIEHELELKWLARMDHLEHRLCIEGGGIYNFWVGKNAPYRWSKDAGLSMIGFGREKTTYCYFAMASSSCLPLDTYSRIEGTKCAILITVADDFFDEKGSMHELSILTDAVQRQEITYDRN